MRRIIGLARTHKTGTDAPFSAAFEREPDVILLDIGLPGMDGYEVCRAFRQDDTFRSIPIIAQTSWGQSRDKAMASEAGFNFHLTKPVPLAELEKYLATIRPCASIVI